MKVISKFSQALPLTSCQGPRGCATTNPGPSPFWDTMNEKVCFDFSVTEGRKWLDGQFLGVWGGSRATSLFPPPGGNRLWSQNTRPARDRLTVTLELQGPLPRPFPKPHVNFRYVICVLSLTEGGPKVSKSSSTKPGSALGLWVNDLTSLSPSVKWGSQTCLLRWGNGLLGASFRAGSRGSN